MRLTPDFISFNYVVVMFTFFCKMNFGTKFDLFFTRTLITEII